MDLDFDVKAEARKQYLKYFAGWFIVLGILLVVSGLFFAKNALKKPVPRTNTQAPEERVYDNADVLTAKEEEKLRKLIAKAEAEIQADIVLVTINQPVEGEEAKNKYSYRSTDWEQNMMDLADDFYVSNLFGYDSYYSGVLLLDNWYKDGYGSQAGSWLATGGNVYEEFTEYKINQVLDEVYYTIVDGGSAYQAYKAYIDEVVKLMGGSTPIVSTGTIVLLALIVPIVVAGIFMATKSVSKDGKVTTNVNTYVNGNTRNNIVSDDFIRKSVSSRRIQSSSSSGGGTRSSGGGGRGGSHVSSSGRTMGGGGRRR